MDNKLTPTAIRHMLDTHTLDAWFPRCIDPQGGFQQNFDRAWQPEPDDTRDLVFQARMLWVISTVARLHNPRFCEYSHHAEAAVYQFEDCVGGGWWPDDRERGYKHSYAISFAIYALAANCRLKPDAKRKQHLLDQLAWWDAHATAEDGTFWDVMDAQGQPITATADTIATLIPSAAGLRSSNTYIHIVEALTEVVEATNSPLARERLLAHVEALEDSLQEHGGRMFESYTRDWRPVDRTISFGHNIEAVTLLHKANTALQRESGIAYETTAERVARYGLDPIFGGICSMPFWSLRGNHHKAGWAQIEAVYGFLLMADLARQANDSKAERRYDKAAEQTWSFIEERLVDPIHPGIVNGTNRRGHVLNYRKGYRWKACYHYTRCLLESLRLMEKRQACA